MKIHHCEQGSTEWLQIRTGKITASEVIDATSFLKVNRSPKRVGDSSGTRDTYIRALVGEMLTGKAAQTFVSKWMEQGSALEPMAREEYAMREGVTVKQVGFLIHPNIPRSGASPDGLVYEGKTLVRGVEFKCPKIETHLDYLERGVLPPDYEPQLMYNMACAPEVQEWDFVSFCPDMPEDMQQFKIRVPRNDERIAEIEEGVRKTLAEADELMKRLKSMAQPVAYKTAPKPPEAPLPRKESWAEQLDAMADVLAGTIED